MKVGRLNPKISTSFALTIVILLIGALLFLILGPGGKQVRNLEKARAHAEILQPILAEDSRFGVRLAAYTGGGGMLWIRGWVETKEDLGALYEAVDQSHPPVPCHWSVRVLGEDELKAIREFNRAKGESVPTVR